MTVTLQYFEDCPSWRVAEERLQDALVEVGLSVAVVHEVVDTPEKAIAARFHGSPTILIDGRDPFDDPSLGVGLSCRLYDTDEGQQGSPSVQQLVAALTSSR